MKQVGGPNGLMARAYSLPRGRRSHSGAAHGPQLLASAVSIILAGTATADVQQTSQSASDSSAVSGLEEIIVTAQRRSQNVLDIPYNISAISGTKLQQEGATSISNLGSLVAGLEVLDAGPAIRGNTNSLGLRGLHTDSPVSTDYPVQTVAPVSTYFGETPVFFAMPLFDIDRVEILRGPQGTLYGSGAEGGTIRFLPNRPDFAKSSVNLNVGTSYTDHAHSPNDHFDGMINLPFSDSLALRVVGGYDHLEGFITDTGLAVRANTGGPIPTPVPRVPGDPTSGFLIAPPLRDANSSNQWFARAALRWAPAPGYDFELGYFYEKTHVDDAQQSNPIWPGGTWDLASAQVPPFPNSSYYAPAGGKYGNTALIQQPFDGTTNLASLVGTVDLGFATFTSASSAYDNKTSGVDDYTFQYYSPVGTNYVASYANFPRFIAYEPIQTEERTFVQEIRLVSPGSQTLDYVVGAYFQHQRNILNQEQPTPGIQQYIEETGFTPTNPEGITSDSVFNNYRTQNFFDRALFGELTWHLTHAWQVTGGMRFFWQSFDINFLQTTPYCGSVCGNGPLGETSVSRSTSTTKHISKLNTSYDLSPETKVYFTYAEGFRRGGANGVPLIGNFASLPIYLTYVPDIAKNYEIGIKGSLADQRVRYTADLFWINLENFQFNSYTPAIENAVFNGDRARSKGAEFEIEAKLTQHADVQLSYSYTDATVTNAVMLYDLPPFSTPGTPPILNISIPAGTRLPGVSTQAVTLGGSYRLPLSGVAAGGWALTWHGDFAYRNGAPANIPSYSLPGWTLSSVKTLNTRLTLETGPRWSVDLYGTNLTSDPGVGGGTGVQTIPNPLAFRNVIRPRTIGIAIHYHP